jgi:hypothetical protein
MNIVDGYNLLQQLKIATACLWYLSLMTLITGAIVVLCRFIYYCLTESL